MRILKLLVVVTAGLACFVLWAQSDAEYQGMMKAAVAANGKMNKGIAAKDAGAAAEATALEAAFKQIEGFWSNRGAVDAVGFAKSAHMAAAAAGKAIAAGDWDKAAAEGKNVQAQCGQCHAVHRGGEKGAYTIK